MYKVRSLPALDPGWLAPNPRASMKPQRKEPRDPVLHLQTDSYRSLPWVTLAGVAFAVLAVALAIAAAAHQKQAVAERKAMPASRRPAAIPSAKAASAETEIEIEIE